MTAKPQKPSQRERFIETARELETDDSPEEFERVFGKIAPPKKAGDVAPLSKGKKPGSADA